MSDYISKQHASLGTEVLSDQLIDETHRHAKTAAENVLLKGEAARLRELIRIEDEKHKAEFEEYSKRSDLLALNFHNGIRVGFSKVISFMNQIPTGDTEPVGAQLRDYVVAASSYRNTISEALAIWESMDSFDDAGDVMDKVIDRLRVGINTGEGKE